MSTVTYTDPALVSDVRSDRQAPPSGQTLTGYGRKIPTRHAVKYAGRWHRVYAMCYGNAGSVYITRGGETLFLDLDTEYLFYTD